MKTKLIFAILTFLFINSSLSATNLNDSTVCLEISGRILNLKVGKHNGYKAELICNGKVVDSLEIFSKHDFKFVLNKNTIYGIRISKPGYVHRIISVDTNLPQYANGFFRFQFDTELIKDNKNEVFNRDALDFPIAIIAFNQNLNNFYYNEEYTSFIKRRIYLGAEF